MPRDSRITSEPLEERIQREIVKYLTVRGWLVERMIGNAYQVGIPDLYLFHKTHGCRWVDVKRPSKYSLTRAQKVKWPLWESHGIGIWILTEASQSSYDLLFQPPNWRKYAPSTLPKRSDVARLLDEITD